MGSTSKPKPSRVKANRVDSGLAGAQPFVDDDMAPLEDAPNGELNPALLLRCGR